MINENSGWALADEGIYRTSDGGVTWLDANPGGAVVSAKPDVFFLDEQTAWALAPQHTTSGGGILYQTVDGGQKWTETSVPFSSGKLFFARQDGQISGWALHTLQGDADNAQVQLFSTRDGGASWHPVCTGQGSGEAADSSGTLPYHGGTAAIVWRPDGQIGWITKYYGLYRSEDGERTWVPQSLPSPAGTQTPADLYLPLPPTFFDSREGVLAAIPRTKGVTRTIIYITHDGGNTWQVSAMPPDTDPFVISFVDPKHGWADRVWMPKEKQEALAFTTDGGQTWKQIAPNLKDVSQLQFVSERVGWGLARNPKDKTAILRTQDGGQTWAQIYPGP